MMSDAGSYKFPIPTTLKPLIRIGYFSSLRLEKNYFEFGEWSEVI